MCLSIYLSTYLSIYRSIDLSTYLSIYLSICKLENKAILRDFLRFWTWQHQKCSNSARLPQLTTSITKLFCETSFKNGKLTAELTASYQCVLRFFHSICLKCCACHKSDARSYEVLRLSRTSIFPKLKIWCSKMHPFSGNQRPDLPTSLMNMSVVLRLPREMHFADPLQMSHACHPLRKCYKTHTFGSLLTRGIIPCACHAKRSLLFDPPEPQIIGKTQCFATFLPFSRTCIFFLLTLLFHLSILSEVWLLNFLRWRKPCIFPINIGLGDLLKGKIGKPSSKISSGICWQQIYPWTNQKLGARKWWYKGHEFFHGKAVGKWMKFLSRKCKLWDACRGYFFRTWWYP